MKKISRIKLLFVALPVIVITLFLFMRWNEYSRSYKSIINWGNGLQRYSETIYYSNRVKRIITKWQDACKNSDNKEDSNNTFLHFDLGKNTIWLEEQGQMKKYNCIELPEHTTWKMKYSWAKGSVILPKNIILRTLKNNQQFAGQFFLYTDTRYRPYCFIFNIQTCSSGSFLQGTIIQNFNASSINPPNAVDYTEFIISEENYKIFKNSVSEINSGQSIEKETPEQITLEENKLKWFDIEKYLYMEIDGQVKNAGYELNSLEVEAGPDYTGAYAIIKGSGESAVHTIHKLFDLAGGSKTVRAYLQIDNIGDGIWYAKTKPHPKRKLESDRKLNLEFLIFAEEQIPRSQYKKYIDKGRRLPQLEDLLSTKWNASLPNGTYIEIIGIRDGNEPDKWWGPDGSIRELPNNFRIEPINKFDDTTLVMWRIKLPEKKEGKQMVFDFDSVKDIGTVQILNRYGIGQNIMYSVLDNSIQKTNFRIEINDNDNVSDIVIFKNISLIPGKDQGYKVEYEE